MSASRVAVASDIHGNALALEAVLADVARRPVDELVCLGDVAAGGPQPCQAIEALRARGCPVVRGNTDDWLLDGLPAEDGDNETHWLRRAVEWARSQLSPDDVEFLRSFQPTIELELCGSVRLHCFHGSPRSNRERILPTTSDQDLDELLEGTNALVLLGGHTHWQMLRRYRGALLVNVGSVGVPVGSLDGRRRAPLPRWAEYAIVEAGRRAVSVQLRRVALHRATLERTTLESGMPDADRWAVALERRVSAGNAASTRRAARETEDTRTGALR